MQSNPLSQELFSLETDALSFQCISTQCWIKCKQGFQGLILVEWINIYANANANANAHSHVSRNLWSKCAWCWISSMDSPCSPFEKLSPCIDLIAGLRFLSVPSQAAQCKCQRSRKRSLLLKPWNLCVSFVLWTHVIWMFFFSLLGVRWILLGKGCREAEKMPRPWAREMVAATATPDWLIHTDEERKTWPPSGRAVRGLTVIWEDVLSADFQIHKSLRSGEIEASWKAWRGDWHVWVAPWAPCCKPHANALSCVR